MLCTVLLIDDDIAFASLYIIKSISFGVTIKLYPIGFNTSYISICNSSSVRVPINPNNSFFSLMFSFIS